MTTKIQKQEFFTPTPLFKGPDVASHIEKVMTKLLFITKVKVTKKVQETCISEAIDELHELRLTLLGYPNTAKYAGSELPIRGHRNDHNDHG